MSTLKAEIVKVEVVPHPNADRLDLCKISGKSWQCVAQKGQYKTGDLAIYLPVDSVLPLDLVAKLGIEKMYHSRLRTVKLRGYVSQGMLMPTSLLPKPPLASGWTFNEGDDFTTTLGISKYEEPIPVEMAGKLLPDEPGMLKYTDIENIKNYPDVFSPSDEVIVREKVHGTNFRAAKLGGKLFVGSHTRNLVRDDGNLYWRAALNILDLDNKLAEGEQVFGEVYGKGVQDLSYGLRDGEIDVVVFDIFKNGNFLSDKALYRVASERFWELAPLLHSGFFSDFQMPKESVLSRGQIIEGAVIRPIEETWSERLQGRKILKSISEEYLLRKDGTERH